MTKNVQEISNQILSDLKKAAAVLSMKKELQLAMEVIKENKKVMWALWMRTWTNCPVKTSIERIWELIRQDQA